MKKGDRVIVTGIQVFEKEDQTGTVMQNPYTGTSAVKVWLDNGKKFWVTPKHVKPHIEHM